MFEDKTHVDRASATTRGHRTAGGGRVLLRRATAYAQGRRALLDVGQPSRRSKEEIGRELILAPGTVEPHVSALLAGG